jgi:hypothetical protein
LKAWGDDKFLKAVLFYFAGCCQAPTHGLSHLDAVDAICGVGNEIFFCLMAQFQ